ncbi:MAG: carbohydrate kinase family protein [Methanomicrobiaceae archaeon]|nr:carbohydrate kinase family protein [Methanomicrobiaceae archaeon]
MISVVGHTAIDHIFRVPQFPDRHDSTYVLDHQVYFGGGAANIAVGIAVLGEPCTLISAVGGDFAGSPYDRWMDQLGVKKDFFVVEEARTATAYLFNDQQGDQITFFEWGASEVFHRMEAPGLEMVHMATADPEFNVRVAKKSGFSSFDPGQDLLRYTSEQLLAILGKIDILFANHHEVATMCRIAGLSREELIEKVPSAVFTLSGEGSILHREGESWHIPAVPVQLVDPTGAGDAYRAGFLTATRRGYDPLTSCRVGTVCASFAVEKVGCQSNLPDWGRMSERYGAYFGTLPPGGGP